MRAFSITLAIGIGRIAVIALIAFAIIGAPIGIFIQSGIFGLGNNFAFYSLTWIALFSLCAICAENKKSLPADIFAILLVALGYSNLFWTNIVPCKGYIGIVTNKEKVVMQTVDSANQTWMRAPSWWRGEKVTWYNVIEPKRDDERRLMSLKIERLLTSVISKEIGIGQKKLTDALEVSILIEPKLDGFTELAGEQPEAGTEGREKILAEAKNILGRVSGASPEQLKNLAKEISALQNDLFKVGKATVNFSSNSSAEAKNEGGKSK